MNLNNQKNLRNVYKPYNDISRELILEIHKFALNMTRNKRCGQTTISRAIKNQFDVDLSESTISGWIHKGNTPFKQENSQFKPKPIPPKEELHRLYILDKMSASNIAKKYNVSTVIAINWLKDYKIPTRTHRESMNTPNIRKELGDLKLTKPTKDYKKLTSEKAYLLGVLCGDGYIDKNFLKLEIRKDTEFIEAFLRCFEEVYGLKYYYYYYKNRNSYIANVTSRIICGDIFSYGRFRTQDWEIPLRVLNSKDSFIKTQFLKGIYDSDGSVSKYTVNLTSSSKKAIEGISKLLKQLGIESKIYPFRKYWTIIIMGRKNVRSFKELVGFTIKRKMERLR